MPAGLSRGGTYALLNKASRKVVAGAICCPPRCVKFGKDEEELGALVMTAGMELGEQILTNPRMETIDQWMQEQKAGLASTLNDNYLYI